MDSELDASRLGTLEYWEQAYENELENFKEYGDEGEIWFGIQTVKRVVSWLSSNENISKTDTKIVDIGCGNGYTCCKLANEGYTQLTGIDYSKKAIELAKSIGSEKNLKIDYQVADIVDVEDQFSKNFASYFNVAFDKGTYDAIGLCPIDPKSKRIRYKEWLCEILAKDGLFIIVSCNWTKDELIKFFTGDNEFEFVEELKSVANFSFGGSTGSTTTTIVFKYLKN